MHGQLARIGLLFIFGLDLTLIILTCLFQSKIVPYMKKLVGANLGLTLKD